MNATAPLQRQFNFLGLNRACLVLGPAVRSLLDCDEDRVVDLIGDRQLVAFDLKGPHAARSYPGIWFQSVRAYWARAQDGAIGRLDYAGEATALVVADILPQRERLRLPEVKRILCVNSTHLHHLIDAGLLAATGGDAVCKAPSITRKSLVRFLTQRRM